MNKSDYLVLHVDYLLISPQVGGIFQCPDCSMACIADCLRDVDYRQFIEKRYLVSSAESSFRVGNNLVKS